MSSICAQSHYFVFAFNIYLDFLFYLIQKSVEYKKKTTSIKECQLISKKGLFDIETKIFSIKVNGIQKSERL